MNRSVRAGLCIALAALIPLAHGCASKPGDARPDGRVNDPLWRAELRERAIETLSRAALGDDPLLRANAVEGLQALPSRAEPFLRAALDDDNLGVRYAGAVVAGRLRMHALAPALRRLLTDPAREVQAAAIFALRSMDEDADPTPLASMLLSGSVRERATAAFVLGELGDASALPLLVDAAQRTPPRASIAEARLLRLQIGEALVKLGQESAMEAIRAALYPSRPEELEATALAVQIIGEVNDRRAIDQLIYLAEPARKRPSGDTDYIDPDTQQMPAEVRLAAAASLAKLGLPRGWFIAEEYRAHADPVLRSQAAYVLGQIRSAEHLGKLERLLDDRAGLVQVAAGAAVLQITDAPTGETDQGGGPSR